jgi:hypothetical protein
MGPNSEESDPSFQTDSDDAHVDTSDHDVGAADEQARFETWLEDFDARHAVLKMELDALLRSLGGMADANNKPGKF